MILCDSRLRRFGDFSDERPAQVEEWLKLLEQMRETRLLRDRKLADAKSAPNGQKAPHVREAFAGISDLYVIQDHRDFLRALLVDDESLEKDITTWYGGAFPRIWMELAQSYAEEQKNDLAQAAFERAVGVLKKQVLAGDIDVQTLAAAPRFEPLRNIESFQRLLAAGEAEINFPAAAGEVRRIQAHGREQEGVTAESLALSHGTNQLVTSGSDGLVKLWQLNPLAWERTLAGHSGPVYSVAVSPDDRRILSGGADGVIRLWDTGTGEQVHALVGHLGAVRGVA